MQVIAGYRAISLVVFAVVSLGVAGMSTAASTQTIVGTVSDAYQIVDEDGQPYEEKTRSKAMNWCCVMSVTKWK